MMDKTTFGKNKAEQSLVMLLNEKNDYLVNKTITHGLNNISKHLTRISIKDDEGTKYFLYKILSKHYKQYVEELKIFVNSPENDKIKSHFYNCILIRLKKHLQDNKKIRYNK